MGFRSSPQWRPVKNPGFKNEKDAARGGTRMQVALGRFEDATTRQMQAKKAAKLQQKANAVLAEKAARDQAEKLRKQERKRKRKERQAAAALLKRQQQGQVVIGRKALKAAKRAAKGK